MYPLWFPQTHDYVEFFQDDSRAVQFGTRYHGGRGGGSKNFPGIDSNPPLEIPGVRVLALVILSLAMFAHGCC